MCNNYGEIYLEKRVYILNNLELNYTHIINKDSNQTVLFLHGWGCDGNIFKQYVENLQDKFNILVLDLYGFGQSIDPKPFFDIYEYAIQVYLLLKRKRLFVKNSLFLIVYLIKY